MKLRKNWNFFKHGHEEALGTKTSGIFGGS